MRFPSFKKKERSLGVAHGKRRYDLPLNKSAGSGFLKLLIALMTVLAMLALAASFALSEMTDRWSSGLENRATVEIPAEDAEGNLLDREKIKQETDKAGQILESHPAVADVQIMNEDEIKQLVAPWLGEDLAMDSVPIPGILSLTFQENAEVNLKLLQDRLQQAAPGARIDTHESWLADLLRFTGALQFSAALLTLVIGITTFVAVAGAVKSRLAIHRDELELLHLMGATDAYITKQIQRHTLILGFQGGIMGALIGGALLFVINWISGEMGVSLLPDFTLSHVQQAFLVLMPVFIAFIGMVTARFTVLRTLAQMP